MCRRLVTTELVWKLLWQRADSCNTTLEKDEERENGHSEVVASKKSHLRLLKELLRGEEKRLEAVATIISPHHG